MPRLLDKIRHENWLIPGLCPEKFLDHIEQAMSYAEAIVVDNVSNMYYEEMPEAGISLLKDCPSAVPPFKFTWVETRAPSYVLIGNTSTPWEGPREWGMLFVTEDLWEQPPEDRDPSSLRDMMHGGLRWGVSGTLFCGAGFVGEKIKTLDKQTGLPVQLPPKHQRVNGPMGRVHLPLNEHGTFIDGLWSPGGSVRCQSYIETNFQAQVESGEAGNDEYIEGTEYFAHWIVALLEPLWLGLSFANCVNVDLVPGRPRRVDRRQWKRKSGEDMMEYRTIQLGGRTSRRQDGGGRGEVANHQKLHLVRGHFKTFTEKAPLLGKHVGTYWFPQQMRGSKKEGVIVHDYNISPLDETIS
jgi:hypothetical protein